MNLKINFNSPILWIGLLMAWAGAQTPPATGPDTSRVVQDTLKKDSPNQLKGKSLLVFTLDVTNAKLSVAENLTEKLFLSMTSTPGLSVSYIRNQVKAQENLGAPITELMRQGLQCTGAGCAGEIARELGYKFALVGRVEKAGAGYSLAIDVVAAKTQSVVFNREERFRQGKKDVLTALPLWGAKIATIVADPGFAKTQADPNLALTEEKKPEEPSKGWKSSDYDPYTSHLKGTRIFGNQTDTLKKSGSPYIVTGNLVIPSGTDLVIEKGVTIYVGGEYTTITVLGKMLAQGTQEEPIKFLSGKKEKANWDWDRLFFRSKERSLLEHVHLENSNYGIVVKNGALTLSNCVLANNSVRGIYLENSSVDILDTRIHKGHLIALQVGDYGEAIVERSFINGNHNGISILDYGTLTLRQTQIKDNDRGLILMDSIAITLENTRITGNRVGVVTSAVISKGVFEGLKGNQSDLEPVQREKIAALVERPAAVTVKRKSRKKDSKQEEVVKKDFAGGIKSLKKDGKWASLIGNVTLGEGYHYPTVPENTTLDVIVTANDSILPGQELTQDKVIPGFHHTASIFSTLELIGMAFDGNMDIRYDDWGKAQLDAISVKSKLGPNSVTLGDINENGSEIYISGLQIRGAKYGLGLLNDRRDKSRLKITGMFGESERPYDEEERVLGSYGERKQEGSAVAQKLVGVASVGMEPIPAWTMNVHYIYSDDKRDGILRKDLSSTSVTTDAPLTSHLIGVENEWRLLQERLTLMAEINVGTVDSTTQAFNLALEKVLGSNDFGLSETEITSMLPLLQPTARTQFIDSNFFLIPTDLIDSAALANFDGLSPDEIDDVRRELIDSIITLAREEEPSIQEDLDATKDYGFRWEDQGVAARLAANFNISGTVFDLSYVFVGDQFYSGGNRFLTKDMRKYELALSKDLTKTLNLNLDYMLTVENSSSNGQFKNLLGFGEGSEIGLWADDKFQKKQEDRERDRPKFTHKLAYKNRYILTPTVELEFKSGLNYKSEMRAKEISGDTNVVFADPLFENEDGSPFIFDNNVFWIDSALADEFKASIISDDNEELPLARVLDDKEFEYLLGLGSKFRFSKWGSMDLTADWKWTDDRSEYKYTSLWDQYDLQDSTVVGLGFYENGEDEFKQNYGTSLTLKNKFFSNKLGFKFGLENKIKRNEDITSWEIKNNLKWNLIPRKLRMTLAGKIKRKLTVEDEERKFALDGNTKRYRYDNDTEELVGNKAENSTSLTLNTPESLTNFVHTEDIRSEDLQTDYNVELMVRYNVNSKLYTESTLSKDWVLRPDQLDQEYEDLFAEVKMYYSF